jgi:hypothetical protein
VWRIYPVGVCYDTRWLTVLWSTEAKVEGIMPMTAWNWGRHNSVVKDPLGIPGRNSLYVGIPSTSVSWTVTLCFSPKKEPSFKVRGSPWTVILCSFTKKQSSYKIGKNLRSPSKETHEDGKSTYNGVRNDSPRGSLKTLLSLHQCHAVIGTVPSAVAFVDQSPVSQPVS